MGRLPAVLLAAIAGCYHANPEQACHVRCAGIGAPCPSNLACQSDGLCHFADGTCPPVEVLDADVRPDVPVDQHIDNCYGVGMLKFCADEPMTPPVMITTSKPIETSTTNADCTVVNVDSQGHQVCLMLVSGLTIMNGSTLSATGTFPLAIISNTTIDVTGFIDVSGQAAATTNKNPAGANLGCSNATAATIDPGTLSAGGGAGGSSGTRGGGGGNSSIGVGGSAGAVFGSNPSPGFVRGGCDGSDGAMYLNSGPGGKGGGAVYLIARTSIVFHNQSWIDASGGSGLTTGMYAGGGGGGAGGLIGLDAPSIDIGTGSLAADGGAGSCGSATTNLGTPGHPIDITMPLMPARGGCMGDATTAGGAGGQGATTNASATGGMGVSSNIGGGGGGGGLGYLLVYGPTTMLGAHSPQPTAP